TAVLDPKASNEESRMISLRIRAGEDRQAIAKQCGTSVDMLEPSYSLAIEDLEDDGPQRAEEERLRARQLAVASRDRQLRVARNEMLESTAYQGMWRGRRLRLPAAADNLNFAAPAM